MRSQPTVVSSALNPLCLYTVRGRPAISKAGRRQSRVWLTFAVAKVRLANFRCGHGERRAAPDGMYVSRFV